MDVRPILGRLFIIIKANAHGAYLHPASSLESSS
jgi:hypothetical protein